MDLIKRISIYPIYIYNGKNIYIYCLYISRCGEPTNVFELLFFFSSDLNVTALFTSMSALLVYPDGFVTASREVNPDAEVRLR